MAFHSNSSPSQSLLREAQLLKTSHRLEEARICLEGALKTYPDDHQIRMELVLVLGELGDKAGALEELETLIKARPYNAEYYRFLTFYKKYSDPEDPQIQAITALLDSPSVLAAGRSSLHFALGKIFEDLKDYKASFDHYEQGNALLNQKIDFSIENAQTNFDVIKDAFDSEFFDRFRGAGERDGTPIFIVGMPRSGTSLVEQVLASHSSVYGAGELEKVWQLYTEHLGLSSAHFDENFPNITPDRIRNCAQFYLSYIHEFSDEAQHITDKMPMNFRYIGFIKAMFPHAKIIHCLRDPRDTGLSIFKQRFVQNIPYAYSLENIMGFYGLYEDLIRHWHDVLPGQIYDFVYEDFIADQRTETGRLLAHCGLEWEDNCLAFHETIRSVNTASATQVKQPLYKGAVGYWKNYEPYMGGAFEVL